jgi:hypothetical protein
MNEALTYLSVGSFLLLPPAMLLARFRVGRRLPWWAIALVIVAGGWLLALASVLAYGNWVCEPVRGAWSPPLEALARCTNDGGRNAFALLFGWLYGPLYSLPWVCAFALASWVRSRSGLGPRHAA